MLAAVPWGLGWLIFGAREFLNTDVMLAGITVIALIGLGLEKFVFEKIERLHRRALGHDRRMTENGKQIRSLLRAALSLAAAAACYEAAARSGYFAPALLPTLETIVRTLFGMIADGTMIEHAAFTLYRVMFGFFLAVSVGLPLGILMARFQRGGELLPAAGLAR